MIPNLVEILEQLGIRRGVAAVVLTAFLTVTVVLAPSVARRFDKRTPQEA